MKSIIYICPTGKNKPTGGIKLIYRQAEILSKLLPNEKDCKIFHFEDFNFKCDWFPHNVDFKKNSTFNSIKEFVIIPEWMAVYHAKILQKAGIKYGIFVQNGFYLNTKPKNNFSDEEINTAYEKAEIAKCTYKGSMFIKVPTLKEQNSCTTFYIYSSNFYNRL